MPRNKKRSNSKQQSTMKKSNEKENPAGSIEDVKREDTPSTSTSTSTSNSASASASASIRSASDAKQEFSVRAASGGVVSNSVKSSVKGFDEEQASLSSRKKRKSFNLMKYFSETDDDEPQANTLTMRYVDVARNAMLGPDEADKTSSKGLGMEINIGLEEFPMLPPSRCVRVEGLGGTTNTTTTTSMLVCEELDISDTSPQGSMDESNESNTTSSTICCSVETNDDDDGDGDGEGSPPEMPPDDSSERDEDAVIEFAQTYDSESFEDENSVCFELDDMSSIASSWEFGSTESSSGNENEIENASCTDDGSGDANNSNIIGDDCSSLLAQQMIGPIPMEPSTSQPQPQPQPMQPLSSHSSAFSQEWLHETVWRLASGLGVSIPQFNFTDPYIDFARNERQFDDPNYLRMEDRAMFSLRLNQNKSFFGDGKYM